jgi:hypothetical protein
VARLLTEPNFAEISKLAGVVDFYQWLGVWCCRKYPRIVHQPGTVPQKRTWSNFSTLGSLWRTLSEPDRLAFTRLAAGSVYTARDLWFTAGLKHLFPAGNSWVVCRLLSSQFGIPPFSVVIGTSPPTPLQLVYNRLLIPDLGAVREWVSTSKVMRGNRWMQRQTLSIRLPLSLLPSSVTLSGDNKFEFPLGGPIGSYYLRASVNHSLVPSSISTVTGLYLFP